MAGKLCLQFFGILLFILLGILNYIKEYNGENSGNSKNRDDVATPRFLATTIWKIQGQSITTRIQQKTTTTTTTTTTTKIQLKTTTTTEIHPRTTTKIQPKSTTTTKIQPETTTRIHPTTTITTTAKTTQLQYNKPSEKNIIQNNFENNLKTVNYMHPRDKQFKQDLKIAIKYVDIILNAYNCNFMETNHLIKQKTNDFKKVFDIITAAAENNYIFHTLPDYTVDFNLIQNATRAINKMMPHACEIQHTPKNKEIFENIFQILNLYYLNFPQQVDSKKYCKCYVQSLLQFKSLNNVIKNFDFKKWNRGRSFVTNETTIHLGKINECLQLRSLKDNQESRNYRSNVNTNLNRLHEIDRKFINRLEIFTQYFNKIIKNYECSENFETYNNNNNNFYLKRMILYISESARENYYHHIKQTADLGKIPNITNDELLKFMPRECEKQLSSDREIFQQLHQLLKIHFENYPRQFINNYEYNECYKNNLKDLLNIENIFKNIYFRNTSEIDRVALNRELLKKIASAMKCVEMLN